MKDKKLICYISKETFLRHILIYRHNQDEAHILYISFHFSKSKLIVFKNYHYKDIKIRKQYITLYYTMRLLSAAAKI